MQIENALDNAYGSRQVSTIYTPTNQYWVILELDAASSSSDPTALALLYVRSTTGQLVPLDAVAKLTPALGPLTVNHLGQLPVGDASRSTSSRACRWATRWPQVEAVQRELRLPATLSTTLPGHRPGVPVLAARAWACCC